MNRIPVKKSEEIVRCIICKTDMNVDDFAEHAVGMHLDDVLDLIDDDEIIECLSEYIQEHIKPQRVK